MWFWERWIWEGLSWLMDRAVEHPVAAFILIVASGALLITLGGKW